MSIRDLHFARYILMMTCIMETLWFFLVWILSFKTPSAAITGTFLLPALAFFFRLIPEDKRHLCTEKDLKTLNDLARGAFFATAAFTVMVLLGVCKYLSADFVKNFLFYVLMGQFVLHVFAVLVFTALAVLAPTGARKKPIKLAVGIYAVSTIMQMVVFPEVLLLIGK